jgi:hypothetical protein
MEELPDIDSFFKSLTEHMFLKKKHVNEKDKEEEESINN